MLRLQVLHSSSLASNVYLPRPLGCALKPWLCHPPSRLTGPTHRLPGKTALNSYVLGLQTQHKESTSVKLSVSPLEAACSDSADEGRMGPSTLSIAL